MTPAQIESLIVGWIEGSRSPEGVFLCLSY